MLVSAFVHVSGDDTIEIVHRGEGKHKLILFYFKFAIWQIVLPPEKRQCSIRRKAHHIQPIVRIAVVCSPEAKLW